MFVYYSGLTDSTEIQTKPPPASSYAVSVSTVRMTQTPTPTSSEKLEEPSMSLLLFIRGEIFSNAATAILIYTLYLQWFEHFFISIKKYLLKYMSCKQNLR